MTESLDKKMSQLGGASKRDVIQSNGALVGFTEHGNFTIKVDEITDIYWGDLSTTWEDIVRAQALGKMVYLRLDIAGMFCLTAGPIKNVVPRFDATFLAMDKVKAMRKETYMHALDSLNEALVDHGYNALTEQDIDDLLDGKMSLERYNEVTISLGHEPEDEEGYKEALEAECPWLTMADISRDEFLDDFVESMRQNPLTKNISVDLTLNTADLGLDSLGQRESLSSSIRIGIGLNYSADLPFPTPTYIAAGMPFIMCVPNVLDVVPVPGLDVDLGSVLFEGLDEALEEAPDDPRVQFLSGLKSAILGNGDALFGLALGMAITKKDEYDPAGLVIDFHGTLWNQEIDIESLLENAELPNGMDTSALYDTVRSLLIQYTGLDIDIGAICNMINDIKITISPRLTFNTVMRLLNAGWDISMIAAWTEYEESAPYLIPGRPAYYGMGIVFSSLIPVESFADGVARSSKAQVHEEADSGTVGSGAARYSYSLITCNDNGDVVFINRQRDGYFRRAIKIVNDMPFRDIFAAACEGCLGYIGVPGYIGWFELVPVDLDGEDAVFATQLNSDIPDTMIICEGHPNEDMRGSQDGSIDSEDPVMDIVCGFYSVNGRIYIDEEDLRAPLLDYWMKGHKIDPEIYIPDWGRIVYFDVYNDGHQLEYSTIFDDGEYAGYSTINKNDDGSGYGERIKWDKRGVCCYISEIEQNGETRYVMDGISGLESDIFETWWGQMDDEPYLFEWHGDDYDGLYEALEYTGGTLPLSLELPDGHLLVLSGIEEDTLHFSKIIDGVLYAADITLHYDWNEEIYAYWLYKDITIHAPRPLETAWQIADEITPDPEAVIVNSIVQVQHKRIHTIHLSNNTQTLTIWADTEHPIGTLSDSDRPLPGEPMQVKVIVMKDSEPGTTDLIIHGTFIGINGQYTLNPDKAYILEVTGPIASFREAELPQAPSVGRNSNER